MQDTADNITSQRDEARRPLRLNLAECAILLDVDGTILDLAWTPDRVVVSTSLRTSLEQLLAGTGNALALVSGRTIRDLDRLFAPLRLPLIGGHGAEMRNSPAGMLHHYARPLPESFRLEFADLANLNSGILIEDKGSSLAVHYRLAPHLERAALKRVEEICGRFPEIATEVLRGKSVLEIKSARFSKGAAILKLMKQPPFRGRRAIFFGDDATDESAFAVLPELGGIGYSVGAPMAGADGCFPSPAAVREWLDRFGAQQSVETP